MFERLKYQYRTNTKHRQDNNVAKGRKHIQRRKETSVEDILFTLGLDQTGRQLEGYSWGSVIFSARRGRSWRLQILTPEGADSR